MKTRKVGEKYGKKIIALKYELLKESRKNTVCTKK